MGHHWITSHAKVSSIQRLAPLRAGSAHNLGLMGSAQHAPRLRMGAFAPLPEGSSDEGASSLETNVSVTSGDTEYHNTTSSASGDHISGGGVPAQTKSAEDSSLSSATHMARCFSVNHVDALRVVFEKLPPEPSHSCFEPGGRLHATWLQQQSISIAQQQLNAPALTSEEQPRMSAVAISGTGPAAAVPTRPAPAVPVDALCGVPSTGLHSHHDSASSLASMSAAAGLARGKQLQHQGSSEVASDSSSQGPQQAIRLVKQASASARQGLPPCAAHQVRRQSGGSVTSTVSSAVSTSSCGQPVAGAVTRSDSCQSLQQLKLHPTFNISACARCHVAGSGTSSAPGSADPSSNGEGRGSMGSCGSTTSDDRTPQGRSEASEARPSNATGATPRRMFDSPSSLSPVSCSNGAHDAQGLLGGREDRRPGSDCDGRGGCSKGDATLTAAIAATLTKPGASTCVSPAIFGQSGTSPGVATAHAAPGSCLDAPVIGVQPVTCRRSLSPPAQGSSLVTASAAGPQTMTPDILDPRQAAGASSAAARGSGGSGAALHCFSFLKQLGQPLVTGAGKEAYAAADAAPPRDPAHSRKLE